MGFRFTLQSANTVANLTFGKVMSCYRDIFESYEKYNEFICFLDDFEEDFYSDRIGYYRNRVENIRNILTERVNYDYMHFHNENHNEECSIINYDEIVLEALRELSRIFQRCKIKALLLPDNLRPYNDFMCSKNVLRKLSHMHPGDG